MAELMVDYITSLDGYGAAEGWPGLWGMGGPGYVEFLGRDDAGDHLLLMGAATYRLFAGFVEDGTEGIEQLTARQPLAWANSTMVRTDAVEAVRALKRDSDVPLRTVGSPRLCASLLRAGLVDRYRVVVFPVVNGLTGSDRMYDG